MTDQKFALMILLSTFSAGFGVGLVLESHLAPPPRVVERLVHDKVTLNGTTVTDDAVVTHDASVETTAPDGTKTVKRDVTTTGKKHEEAKVVTAVEHTEKVTIPAPKPKNRVSLDLGMTLSRDRLGLPLPEPYRRLPLVVGARYEHRLGQSNAWVGVWANSNKTVGIGASLEF